MAHLRFSRLEERRQRKRLSISVIGSVLLLLFLIFFGVKILTSFSLLVDKLRSGSPTPAPSQVIILPPTLDPLPESTNSAQVAVSGRGQSGLSLVLYVNEAEAKRITVPDSGKFTIPQVTARDGTNVISAKLIDDENNMSDLSNILRFEVKKTAPKLEVTSPDDNSAVTGDSNIAPISGRTEDDVSLTVNDRFIVIANDGTFTYSYPLAEGENTLKIVATDDAGNQTTVERHVTYQK